jgi:hypothetical protein
MKEFRAERKQSVFPHTTQPMAWQHSIKDREGRHHAGVNEVETASKIEEIHILIFMLTHRAAQN